MATRLEIQRIRELQERVRIILLDDWDPIGVKDVAEAQDEYDSYVGPVSSLIVKRQGGHPIAELLHRIETDRMGLSGSNLLNLERVGAKLAALADEMLGA